MISWNRAGCLAALLLFAFATAGLAQEDLAAAATSDDNVTISADDAPLPSGPPLAVLGGPSDDLKPRAVRAQVAKSKAAVKQALASPERSATEYFAKLQGQAEALKASGEDLPHHLAVLQADSLSAQGIDAAAAATHQRQRFVDALKRVDELNAKSGPMLAYGITPFMHLTPEEFRQNYLGGKRKPVPSSGGSARKLLATATRTFKGQSFSYDYICAKALDWKSSGQYGNQLLTSIDWRKSNLITPVRDQGDCGSCVAFANFAAIESAYIQKNKAAGATTSNTDLSEQESMNCMSGDQCDGANGYEYIDRSICKGVAKENAAASTKYKGVDSNRCPSTTSVARVPSGVKAYTFVDPTPTDVRKALYHGPVAIGIAADDSFMFYSSGVIGCRAGDSGGLNHETTIVAYTQSSSSKYFTVKNSWTTDWGSSGYYNLRADCPGGGALSMYTDAFLTLAIKG